MGILTKDDIVKQLNVQLTNCMNNELFVTIHMNKDGVEMRNCIIPEDVYITQQEIHIESGLFQINIDNDINEIKFIEIENSYHIKGYNNLDLNLDFV
ncbi:hypothetical protein [Clostridium sp.]|uniref:hypothetical protein n=1 Tax=Clostridium sp. TaxID=1506 RepID=UPI0032172FD1